MTTPLSFANTRFILRIAFVIAIFASWARAQSDQSTSLLQAEQAALQQAVAQVASAVVQIETFGGLDQIDDQAAALGPVTGTIIDPEGWIVASLYGLRQQPASILVALNDGSRLPARIAARDYSREVALLKIEPPIELSAAMPSDPDQWQVGQWCAAIGKTYDPQSVTQSYGIISALGRAYGRAVQTDAKVSPINYGGPLVDLQGKVIGILAPVAAGEMLEGDGSMLYDSGIGFAVPLTDILTRLPKLKQGEDVRPGRLGVVTSSQNEMAGPVVLSGSAPGSPAARAGIQRGDIIINALGRPIRLLADLREALAQVDAGQSLTFTVSRSGEQVDMSVQLVAEVPVYRRRYLGLRLENAEQGLRVLSVADKSPAARAGLVTDSILIECNGQKLQSKLDLAQLISVSELDIPMQLSVIRPGEQASVHVAIQPETWPSQLSVAEPASSDDTEIPGQPAGDATAEISDLKLADIPNKIHAIVPTAAKLRELGCLLVYPEPGELSPDRLLTQWGGFSQKYGWLVVFVGSADPQQWSPDEVELTSRLLARLDQEYSIDRFRTVVGGMGVGGRLALMSGMMESQKVAAVWTLGTPLRSFQPRQPSAPMQTMDFLFVGDKHLDSLADQLNRMGYVANWLASPNLDLSQWNTVPFAAMVRWLENLGQL